MIYKFKCNEFYTQMEVQLREDLDENYVSFTLEEKDNLPLNLYLSKKDIYHLIGALHLLQKEMK